jgi:hypothetical protein
MPPLEFRVNFGSTPEKVAQSDWNSKSELSPIWHSGMMYRFVERLPQDCRSGGTAALEIPNGHRLAFGDKPAGLLMFSPRGAWLDIKEGGNSFESFVSSRSRDGCARFSKNKKCFGGPKMEHLGVLIWGDCCMRSAVTSQTS